MYSKIYHSILQSIQKIYEKHDSLSKEKIDIIKKSIYLI